MLRVLSLSLCALLWFAALGFAGAAPAHAAGWEDLVEFRDTVKPDTVPDALVQQGKIVVQPWTDDEKAEMRDYTAKVFERVPGLFRLGASQGPIPFYRVNMGSSFGGHGSLWLSYMNSSVIAHELTHVADAEHKIARSAEFRALVEPRIRELRAAMKGQGFTDYASAEGAERKDIIHASGLPSFYAVATIQETLAEYVRAAAMDPAFKAPPEIEAFLDRRVLNAPSKDDPSVALYRTGKAARLNRKLQAAYNQLSQAIESDADFAEAYIERGLTLLAANQQQPAIDDFTAALGLMSEFDWHRHVPYTKRGTALALMGQYDAAMTDLLEAKRLSPKEAGLDTTIAQVKFMADRANKRK
ncbi:tetratricopeptide repeat protein [Pseudomonadota bacterium]